MDASRLDHLARELAASRAELVGLLTLVVGGVVVAVLVAQRAGPTLAADTHDVDVAAPTVAAATPTGLVVHVTGAVQAPGVVELSGDARVVDAVAAAGDARSDAALDGLNLARQVVDGEHLHVPTVAELASATGAGAAGDVDGPPQEPSAWLADGRLDLSRATATDLEELPGVGPVLAERIVTHRDEAGGFAAVGQLREVSGIGEKTFQALAELVVVP